MDVEICINCDSEQSVSNAVAAAYQGGAARVELCSAMHEDGLTPSFEKIREARKAFGMRAGVMVMVRPRGGDFCFSPQEVQEMHSQIRMAGQAGADGVVIGVLEKTGRAIALDVLKGLMTTCREHDLQTTFHRAFDAAPDPIDALEAIKHAGIQRILTSGMPWGQGGTALDGVSTLQKIIDRAGNAVEIVIGGGVNKTNIVEISKALNIANNNVSLHAYSGAQENGQVTVQAVRQLVAAARQFTSNR